MCTRCAVPVPENPFRSGQRGWSRFDREIARRVRQRNKQVTTFRKTYCQIPLLNPNASRACNDPHCKRSGCMKGRKP